MKRSLTYYHNRRLLKELTHDGVKYRPKVEDIEKWFHILNEQIFGNKLPEFAKIKVKRLTHKNAHAFYVYWPKKDNIEPELEMDKVYKDEKFFVEILVHEMIHHFQHSYNEPLGHGPSFTAWSDNLKLKGLTLYKAT